MSRTFAFNIFFFYLIIYEIIFVYIFYKGY